MPTYSVLDTYEKRMVCYRIIKRIDTRRINQITSQLFQCFLQVFHLLWQVWMFRRQRRGRQQPEAEKGSTESLTLYPIEHENSLTLKERRQRQSLSTWTCSKVQYLFLSRQWEDINPHIIFYYFYESTGGKMQMNKDLKFFRVSSTIENLVLLISWPNASHNRAK